MQHTLKTHLLLQGDRKRYLTFYTKSLRVAHKPTRRRLIKLPRRGSSFESMIALQEHVYFGHSHTDQDEVSIPETILTFGFCPKWPIVERKKFFQFFHIKFFNGTRDERGLQKLQRFLIAGPEFEVVEIGCFLTKIIDE